jgi:hypothetical protein
MVKLSGLIFLSILLLHSGVAWTFENCLRESEAANCNVATYSEPSPPTGFSALLVDTDHHVAPKLHCFSQRETGPMAQAPAGPRLTQRENVPPAKTLLIFGFVDDSETNSLRLALFERYERPSFRSGTHRHRILSVFRL